MSWLLSTGGFKVNILEGGYKAFRNLVLKINNETRNIFVLGGPTGSGKTEILDQLLLDGEQVLQLEKLANHKGSAFGALGQKPQPSSEHFENMIAVSLFSFDESKPIWVENESRSIGSCILPAGLYENIRSRVLIHIEIEMQKRVDRIAAEYGKFSVDELTKCSEKIRKRLGPQHLKLALEKLHHDDFNGWLEIILNYYDKLYDYGTGLRDPQLIHKVDLRNSNENEYVSIIKSYCKEKLNKSAAIKSA